jgi:superfamily I DNA/RNA helicase
MAFYPVEASYSAKRRIYGTWQEREPSRFLDEIPEHPKETVEQRGRREDSQLMLLDDP